MNRIMALDPGSRRIGIALSDPLRLTASPVSVYQRKSLEDDVRSILEIARDNDVDLIVMGRPLHLDGAESEVGKEIEPLFEALRDRFEYEVLWCEERLSSKEAERIMLRKGFQPGEIRRNRDSFSAALILTWYLEERYDGRNS